MIFSRAWIKMIVVVVDPYNLWMSIWWYQKEKIDANHDWDLPTGFHADIIIRRSSGLFLILSITVANWSTPWPLYSTCMLMYLAPKWRHWNPYTGPRSPSSRSCKPTQKLHWDVNHKQWGWGRGSPLLHLTSQIYLKIIHERMLNMSWL